MAGSTRSERPNGGSGSAGVAQKDRDQFPCALPNQALGRVAGIEEIYRVSGVVEVPPGMACTAVLQLRRMADRVFKFESAAVGGNSVTLPWTLLERHQRRQEASDFAAEQKTRLLLMMPKEEWP